MENQTIPCEFTSIFGLQRRQWTHRWGKWDRLFDTDKIQHRKCLDCGYIVEAEVDIQEINKA